MIEITIENKTKKDEITMKQFLDLIDFNREGLANLLIVEKNLDQCSKISTGSIMADMMGSFIIDSIAHTAEGIKVWLDDDSVDTYWKHVYGE
jgi:hypothetical protein